ncbi:MAG: hypothetical protein CL869_01025 [Cytophagia bacterium]|nr:hypothetical protein [Cytophagia bacterium]
MFKKILFKIYELILFFDKSYGVKKYSLDEASKIQNNILHDLINKSRYTKFGLEHDFKLIKSYKDFKKKVPTRDYEQFKNYIDLIKKGEKDILWPGKPIYFAKTSGTTSGIKYIPVSKESIKNQVKSAGYLLFDYLKDKNSLEAINGKAMFISGSPSLVEENGIKIGRLSGIVNHHEPFYLKGMLLPSKETNKIKNWEEKIEKIVEETIGEDLRVIGGIPPWIQMYFDYLIIKTGKKIKDIFPNLKLICHGGVNFEPYKSHLFNSIGKEIDTLETFPASEGFFAYQNELKKNDLILQINSGIFYEFIDLENLKSNSPERICIKDIEKNKNYSMILTTNSGLWSYEIGDTIKFTSLNPPKIRVTGRIKQYISAFGEHVIVEEVDKSLKLACKRFKEVKVIEYTVGPYISNEKGKSCHEWLIEFSTLPNDIKSFEKCLDENLQHLNIYYRDLISDKVLSRLKVKIAKRKSFINFMKSIGKLGGQNKVPRLSNDRKIIDRIISLNKI